MRIIGFDFGRKRIGIATGNLLTRTAQALNTIPAKNGVPDWPTVEKVVQQWNPNHLIVGLPLRMDGSESEMSTEARRFGHQLEKQIGIEVIFVDERLTSAAADTLLRESAVSGKSITNKRKKSRDSIAAELIIHTYIEDNPTL